MVYRPNLIKSISSPKQFNDFMLTHLLQV